MAPFQKNENIKYLTFPIFSDKITHAIFTRQGGLSSEPWNGLNVGGGVGDNVSNVRENRYLSFRAMHRDPESLFDVWQVHSADVVISHAPHPRIDTV